ncbi:subtilisin-like protease 4 [Lolium rigidum]|uniref:subtilisin-like protease 4 n=1 Tax=Lolium rigidum TaxID=89674 RepID=UPI001F5D9D4B|nr:subtilisin-like protease 4 [Lolium rigidum]
MQELALRDQSKLAVSSFRFSVLYLLPFLLVALVAVEGAGDERRTFIVHVQPQANHVLDTADDRKALYQSFLPDHGRLLHAYHHVASGFAARLTQREVQAMSDLPGFVAAVPGRVYKLHTTHTPQFLGLDTQQGTRNCSYGSGDGVIIGVLDSGVTPDHPSFSGDGMPPPPAKWKGRCDFNGRRVCNNKLIGARVFDTAGNGTASSSGAPLSPIDVDGHGTHTSTTAAGAVVPGAQVLGQGRGTASGIAPRAYVAMYKVCTLEDCTDADILAGIDAAVADGCDIISMSLGGPSVPFHENSMAVGTFAAVEKGVFVSMSAGNSGPDHATMENEAPWMLTVAASTMDRLIRSTVRLGNGLAFDGESVYQPNMSAAVLYPLVYAGASSTPDANFCGNGSLDGFDVRGKIVLCDRGNGVLMLAKGVEVLRAGGVGMVLANQFIDGFSTLAISHVLPASHVSHVAGVAILNYIKTTARPTAQFSFGGTVLGTSPAPAITFFSSRGPSTQNPGILKPDITGPGASVVAAWPFQVGPPSAGGHDGPTFNFQSGTSMSAPHLSGIAALIKSKHPEWSPAAIKSAIMTTADITDRFGKPILDEQLRAADLFAVGAGHVNPEQAMNPGLVYDITPADYIGFLCGLYTNKEVSIIARKAVDCSAVKVIPEHLLNYPSITVIFPPSWDSTVPMLVERTVKNVGEVPAVYYPHFDLQDNAMNVSVVPASLRFSEVNQVKTYTVTVWLRTGKASMVVQGALRWVSDKYTVRSPICITFAGQ